MSGFDTQDFKHLIRELESIGKAAGKVVGQAGRAGINTARDAIAAAAPVYPTKSRVQRIERQVKGRTILPGGNQASVGAVMERATQAHEARAKAGPGVGKEQVPEGTQVTKGKSAVPYSHLTVLQLPQRFTGSTARVDKKTGRVKIKQTGKQVMNRGSVEFNPWVERASSAAQGAIEAAIVAKVEEGIKAARTV